MASRKLNFFGKQTAPAKEIDINEDIVIKRRKNPYYMDGLSELEIKNLEQEHFDLLDRKLFNAFTPQINLSISDINSLYQDKEESINSITLSTNNAYKTSIIDKDIDTKNYFNEDINKKLLCFYIFADYFLHKKRIDYLYGDGDKSDDDFMRYLDLGKEDIDENLKKAGGSEMTKAVEAVDKYIKEGKITSILSEAEKVYCDIMKFNLDDKYSIRLGDGKYFVASDQIITTFRDPSENPSWAQWFLTAVPLKNVPSRSKLLMIPPEEREQYYPEAIPDRPIICHASLWKLGESASGVMLHTSWNHISVSYRWKIDKPIEISSILFRAVSHPAHIARNFGYAPQLKVPGDDWF